jgi:hypothetical protein
LLIDLKAAPVWWRGGPTGLENSVTKHSCNHQQNKTYTMKSKDITRLILAMAAAILCVTALNGCASNGENPNDKPGSLPGRPGQVG